MERCFTGMVPGTRGSIVTHILIKNSSKGAFEVPVHYILATVPGNRSTLHKTVHCFCINQVPLVVHTGRGKLHTSVSCTDLAGRYITVCNVSVQETPLFLATY